jgi:hypothetical protein
MAGEIRQPIDIAALERYINDNVKEIQVPISVKQVGRILFLSNMKMLIVNSSLDMDSPTQPIRSQIKPASGS